MTKKRTWKVPLIKGTDIAWTEHWRSCDQGLDFVDPDTYKFDATIKFDGIVKGWGSGCKMFVKDTERTYVNKNGKTCIDKNGEPCNITYGVFLVDSYDIIMKMKEGIMSGTFTVCKRGEDYGIKLA